MNTTWIATAILGLLAGSTLAQTPKDDFAREGNPAQRAKKDPLEGKAPPPLDVSGWMNSNGRALKLGDLRGKVVVLKFWGVW